jgi:hypothetical protein
LRWEFRPAASYTHAPLAAVVLHPELVGVVRRFLRRYITKTPVKIPENVLRESLP